MFDRLVLAKNHVALWCVSGAVLGVSLGGVLLANSLADGHAVRRPREVASVERRGVARQRSGARAQAGARAVRRERWLAGPRARAQRVASQMAFHDLRASTAQRLLVRDFGSILAGASANPAVAMERSGHVVRYLNSFSALVRTSHGLRVETSTAPLRVADADGSRRLVDLRLRTQGGRFTPSAPLTAVAIARKSDGGVAIGGDGLRVTLLGTNVPGSVVAHQSVFFGSVGRDVDAVVTPEIHGADLSALLRSRMSPDQLRYLVALPAGAKLQAVDGAAIVSRAGGVLARIPAPTARDAQGALVPVRMAVSGDELVLTVSSRRHSIDYPVLVDPEVVVNITENAGAWEFHYETSQPVYCEGFPSRGGTIGCESDGMFTHKGPGGTTPLTLTMPTISLPFSVMFEYEPKKFEERLVEGASGEVWWLPSGHEGITAVEFEGITSSWSGESGAPGGWELEACHEYDDWEHSEATPSSARMTASTGHSCNEHSPVGEPVLVGMYASGASRAEYEETKAQEGTGGSISVGAVLVTRMTTTVEEEELERELFGQGKAATPDRIECFKGRPVNCATGNQVETQTDLSVGGRGLGLNFDADI